MNMSSTAAIFSYCTSGRGLAFVDSETASSFIYSKMSTSSTARPAAAEEDSLEKEAKNRVYYEVETSTGRKAIVVYRVHEVYVHIPPELSAAGFELKIGGTVVITDQVG